MMKYAAKFSVHKGKVGGFQAGVIPPTWTDSLDKEGNRVSKVTKEGAVLLEMAPFLKEENGNKFYDWASKKVSFALGIPDIAGVLGAGGGEFKLIHQNEKTSETKTLQVTPGKDQYEGTFMLSVSVTPKEGEKHQSRISFTAGEWAVFLVLLRSQVPVLLGWDDTRS